MKLMSLSSKKSVDSLTRVIATYLCCVSQRYRQLSKELHPDNNPNAPPEAFIDVRDAHEVLTDPSKLDCVLSTWISGFFSTKF